MLFTPRMASLGCDVPTPWSDTMARTILWGRSVPRFELDHRAREARLQLLRIESLAVHRPTFTHSWLRQFAQLFGFRAARRGDRRSGSLAGPLIGPMRIADYGAAPIVAVQNVRWGFSLLTFSIVIVLVGGTAVVWLGSPLRHLWPVRRRTPVPSLNTHTA